MPVVRDLFVTVTVTVEQAPGKMSGHTQVLLTRDLVATERYYMSVVASELERLWKLRQAEALSMDQYNMAINIVLGIAQPSPANPSPTEPSPAHSIVASSIFAAHSVDVCAVPFSSYSKDAPRRKLIEKKAKSLLRKAKHAFMYTHELRVRSDHEADPGAVRMSEATVMNVVEVALDACDGHFKEQLEYDGAKLKVGRAGCYGADRDIIQRGEVSIVRPGSDTGTHSTNEGCLPELTRLILLGECRHGEWQPKEKAFKDDFGLSYELLQKAEQHAVTYLKEKYGEAKIANNAGGHQGREQYGPQRYLYVNVCDHTRAAQIVATHFHAELQGSSPSRKRSRPYGSCYVTPPHPDTA